MAVQEIERSVKELGLRGLKLHPTTQAFFPIDDIAADFPTLTIIMAHPAVPFSAVDRLLSMV